MSIPDEIIASKIYLIRNRKVMLDMDLSDLYDMPTKQLKRAVRRNTSRFPEDFMFELSIDELADWRRQFGTSNRAKMGIRIPPFAFTEYGVLMLASVLNSERAIQVNIQIVRIFARMREILFEHKEFLEKIREIEIKITDHEERILLISEYLRIFEKNRQQQEQQSQRKRIGYRKED